MFVPCPHCGFLVALIVARNGAVAHCPRCHRSLQSSAVDDATPSDRHDTVVAGHPPGESDPVEPGDADARPEHVHVAGPAADAVLPSSATAEAAAPVQQNTPPGTASMPSDVRMPRSRGTSPSFARVPLTAGVRRPRWPGMAIIALLTMSLLLQLLLAQRTELAADARWRPWVDAMCNVLQCQLPTWHQPDAWTMLARNVQPKPGQPGVLDVSASFRNDADWPQAWPTLLLTLSDIEGRPVAARRFPVDEYRPQVPSEDRLAPGQSASVRFEVIEPAPRIVAFTFDFR